MKRGLAGMGGENKEWEGGVETGGGDGSETGSATEKENSN